MIHIDEKHWPLIVFRFSGSVSLSQLEEYLARQDKMLARKQTMAALVLTENLKVWDSATMRRQADWMKANVAEVKKYNVGAALVIDSPLVRGMLKAVLWMQPMPQPHHVTGSVEEALHWVLARLASQNVRVEMPKGLF
jgi:hypothetical protein